MKKYLKYIFAIAAVSVMVPSCDLAELSEENSMLNTKSPSTFDAPTVYSSYELAEQVIFGISETFVEVNSYRGRFLPWYGFNTDIEWYNTFKEKSKSDAKTDIGVYNIKSNNSQMNTAQNGVTNNPWALMYMGIERANLAIQGIRTYGGDKAGLKYLLGEALTLRAMIYYDLIKAWGDVPARFEPTTSATIYQARVSRDIVFKQILADLEETFGYLYYPGSDEMPATKRTDRINKAFAQGLYARIALLASGYALRPDDGAVGTGNAGSVRLSSDPELAKSVLYPKALAYLKEVIDSKSCSLEDFRTMWYNLNNMNNLTAGPAYETLYVIPFGDNRGRWNFTFAILSEGGSPYNASGSTDAGDVGPTPNFFFKYADGDVRRDVTCANYKWSKDGSVVPSGIDLWSFGKYRFEWMDYKPYGGGNDDGVKPVVMRYADILLMAAEIENELNGPAKAKAWLQEVRQRACGEAAAETYVNSVSGSKDSFFKAIVDERAFEFCGEFLRKADLIRWNLLKSKMDESIAEIKKLRNREAPFDYVQKDIWYQFNEDSRELVIYGLKKGETGTPAGEWEKVSDYVTYNAAKPNEGLGDNRVGDGFYFNTPEEYMYWPIFDCNVTDSQKTLVNDYKY